MHSFAPHCTEGKVRAKKTNKFKKDFVGLGALLKIIFSVKLKLLFSSEATL